MASICNRYGKIYSSNLFILCNRYGKIYGIDTKFKETLSKQHLHTLFRKWYRMTFCLLYLFCLNTKNNTYLLFLSSLPLEVRIINIGYLCSFNIVSHINRISKGRSILFDWVIKNSTLYLIFITQVVKILLVTEDKCNLKCNIGYIVYVYCKCYIGYIVHNYLKIISDYFCLILPLKIRISFFCNWIFSFIFASNNHQLSMSCNDSLFSRLC